MIKIKKEKIKNITKFYSILQEHYHLRSEGDSMVVESYKDPFEPAWLRDLCLKKDVERALELSSR